MSHQSFQTAKEVMDQINYERLQKIIQDMHKDIKELKVQIFDLKNLQLQEILKGHVTLGEMITKHHNSLDWVIDILVNLSQHKEKDGDTTPDEID